MDYKLDSYEGISAFLIRRIKDLNNPPKKVNPNDRPAGANNTRFVRIDDSTVALKFHKTNIITYYKDGQIKLNTDGWKTVSTRDRMNRWQNHFDIYSNQHITFVSYRHNTYLYEDQMILYPSGLVTLNDIPMHPYNPNELKKLNELKKKAEKYVNKFIDKFFKGEISKPSQGDCFYCQVIVEKAELINGKLQVTGKCTNGNHILRHINEPYFVPTLLANAINNNEKIGVYGLAPIDKHNITCAWNNENASMFNFDMTKRRLKLILKRYVFKQIGLGVT